MEAKETTLTKQMKISLLNILKKGTINQADAVTICTMAGLEPHSLTVEIIDKTSQVEQPDG